MRPLDNPYIDRLTRQYRTLHGNVMLEKDESMRGILKAMRAGRTAGVLMDTNMMLSQGIFVDFFEIPACTTSSVARVALRTGAAVVPGFTIWDPALRKYRLRFEPELKLIQTGDDEKDVIANTALFTSVIEDYVRRYPDQWLWVHRRWKTRPEGEPTLY
jgi:KDO2-lipid IV(A) lauroyltransferase